VTAPLIVRREAEADLAKAWAWYEKQRKGLGGEYLDEFAKTLNRIEQDPFAYRPVRKELRRALLRRFPYGVFFIADAERVVVIAVLHAARNPRLWARRLTAAR
jgi:toxin ParE1/3/4